jgi:hypothetical protein
VNWLLVGVAALCAFSVAATLAFIAAVIAGKRADSEYDSWQEYLDDNFGPGREP